MRMKSLISALIVSSILFSACKQVPKTECVGIRDIENSTFLSVADTTELISINSAFLNPPDNSKVSAEWNIDFNKPYPFNNNTLNSIWKQQASYADSPFIAEEQSNTLHETDRVAFAQLLDNLFRESNLPETCFKEVRDSLLTLYINRETSGLNVYRYALYNKEIKIRGKNNYLCYLEIKLETGHGQKLDSIGKARIAVASGSKTISVGSVVYMGNLIFKGILKEVIIGDKKIEGIKGHAVNHKGFPGSAVYFNEITVLQPSSFKEDGIKRHHKVYTQFLEKIGL
jgi:hypothetical protein